MYNAVCITQSNGSLTDVSGRESRLCPTPIQLTLARLNVTGIERQPAVSS